MKKYLIAAAVVFSSLVALPSSAAAANVFSGACRGEAQNSAVCRDNKTAQGGANPFIGSGGILTTIINIVSIIVGIAATIAIILAGFKLITSGSNPQDVTNARERIIYAVVALIIAASAQVIVRFVLERIVQ